MHGNAPLSPFTSVPGWESEAEQRLLMELAAQVPANGVIVEIGGEYGMSASLFCRGAHNSVDIVTVDLFPGDLLAQHRANLAEAGFSERTFILQGESTYFAVNTWSVTQRRISIGLPEDGQIDLLFIDGDHTYEGVLADLENWTPFVKQGGVVVLHDVACETNKLPHALHYEVKRALDKWRSQNLDDWMWIKSVDSTVVLERVGKEVTELGKDYDTILSRQAAPAKLTPTTDMVDVDDEVHAPVEPELYDNPTYDEMTHYEPKEKPKRRTRKSKK